MVVSVAVNVGTISRRVRLREASASKPSMKCRKRIRRCQNRGLTLVWGFRCQGVSAGRRMFFLRQFDPLSSPRPALRSGRRAQVRSRLVVAPTLRHARPLLGRADDQRGARFRARTNRATTLYSVGRKTRTMMQPCASAAKLRSGGPILPLGMTAMSHLGTRHLEPSSATSHKRTGWAETVRCLQ